MPDELGFLSAFRVHDVIGLGVPIGPVSFQQHGATKLTDGNRMVATAYAKSDSQIPAVVQPITDQLSSPGEPVENRQPSIVAAAPVIAAKL